MKRTTRQPRKAHVSSARFGLLAAASGFAIVGAIGGLSAQSVGEVGQSGGVTTAGIPIADDVFGGAGSLQPVGVGPAANQGVRSPLGSVGSSRTPSLGTSVRRGRWTTSVTPFVEGTATYSDNINLESDDEEEETILSATAGVTLGAQSERIAGQLSYAATYDTFLNNTNDDGFRHNLNTSWSAAVIPNLFHIDAQGGITEVFNTTDRFSGNATSNSDDRSRAFFGLISPSLRKNIGGWANGEVRYTLRGETFDDDQDGGFSQQISAGLTGDPRKFRRFGWQASTEYEVFTPEDDDDNDDLTRWTSSVSIDVPVTPKLAVIGTAGYDFFSDDVADDDLSGAFVNAGLRWQPTTRFGARGFAGWRYDGLDYGVEANYALRQNVVARVQARRGVQFSNFALNSATPISTIGANGRPSFLTPNGGTTTDVDQALAFDNRNPENQGLFGDINRSDQDDDSIVDTLQASISGQTGRTAWNANVQAADFDRGSAFGVDEFVLSANGEVSRQLTSRLSASAGVGFATVQFDDAADGSTFDDGDFETLSLGFGLDYQLTEIVNVFGRYTYTERFADQSEDEFTENAGVIGVTARF